MFELLGSYLGIGDGVFDRIVFFIVLLRVFFYLGYV